MLVDKDRVAGIKYRDGLGTVALKGGVSKGRNCANTWFGDGGRVVYDVRVGLIYD